MLLNSVSFLVASAVLSFAGLTDSYEYYSTGKPSQCGYETSDLEGTISSPSDAYYGRTCVWNITVPVKYTIHLRITNFKFPGVRGNCSKAAWLIISGQQAYNNSFGGVKLCGSEGFPGVYFFGNNVNIEYNCCDGGYEVSYFTLEYRAVHVSIAETTAKWISENEDILLSHKESLPRALPALRLFDETQFSKQNITGYKFKTQYLLKLSADLLRNSSQSLTAADLSHHVFALLAVCINPRSFHGIDLVRHLRSVVHKCPSPSKPFDLFSLCSAGENLTSGDIRQLNAMFRAEKPNIYLLDFQAISVMTLVCAKKQMAELSVNETLQRATDTLSSYQKEDGSFGSLRSTVLIFQALSAAGARESSWNKTLALRYIKSRNQSDGSFGNIYDMYTVLPVLKGKTLLDINATKCNFSPEGLIPLQEIKDKLTEHISLTYQLWINDGAEIRYTVVLKFPKGTQFFDVMRLAAEKDEQFQLKWTFMKGDIYVYEIAGHINDPTGGKYWNLYTFNENNELVPFEERLESYIPSDGETAVMWYKTVDMHQIDTEEKQD